MAVSIVGYTTVTGADPATTITVNRSAVDASLGGTVTDGDLLVAVLSSDFGTVAAMVASTGTWTEKLAQGSSGSGAKAKVFLRTAASEPTSWVFGQGSGSDGIVTVIALRGGDNTPANIIGAIQSTGTTTSTTQTTPTVDHAGVAGSILLLGATIDSGGANTWTPPGTTSEIADAQPTTFTSHTVAYLASPADPTGTFNFTNSFSGTQQSAGVQWALVVAPAGSAPTLPAQPSKVSDRGTLADATAATTSVLTVTSPTAIAVGNYLIARVAVDNSGSSGAAPGCTITDARNTWTVLGPSLSDPGAAAAGATAYLCYVKVSTAYQAADTITFNWGGISTTAKAIVLEEWASIHRITPVAATAVTNNSVAAASTTAVTTGAITATTPNQLVYAMLATEGIAADTVGADADTTNGSWVTLTTTASANATATNNQRVSGQYKQVTAAGAQTWDSTITSRDWAAIAVVFAVDEELPAVYVRPGLAAIQGSCW